RAPRLGAPVEQADIRMPEHREQPDGTRRAGTIPGAVHVFWREHLDARSIIAVCHGGYRSANTLLALKSLGYPRVRNYVGSWAEWGNRDDSRVVVLSEASA
ncbi:MAG TPA: rhodanese-like domain-containing protein, partial [Burkholderiales bacterium]|nr:rhodanese-like domain-containing protein [Burkholderiales bacterium]